MKLLVTAFEPFGEDDLNAAQEAIRDLPETIDDAEIRKMILPVVFGKSLDVLRECIQAEQPDAVLCLGQAGGRKAMTPERTAVNLMDAKQPDNAGQQPAGETIFADGPDSFLSTLPVKEMAKAIQDAGIPAEVSDSAGTYVCNQTMYGLLYYLSRDFPKIRGGFLHLPYTKEQTAAHPGKPGLEREALSNGVIAAVRAIIKTA